MPDLQYLASLSWKDVHTALQPYVGHGGSWKPRDCIARQRLVVIVPYRDRAAHLRAFLMHMHPYLQRQMIQYKIYVFEQVDNSLLINMQFKQIMYSSIM